MKTEREPDVFRGIGFTDSDGLETSLSKNPYLRNFLVECSIKSKPMSGI